MWALMALPAGAAVTPGCGRILVVDDERAVRSALEVNLSKARHEVVSVANAEDALAALRERPMDVVLTDVMMPGMSGIELPPRGPRPLARRARRAHDRPRQRPRRRRGDEGRRPPTM